MGKTMGLLGRKVGMTQVFTEEGERVPVTVIAAGPCLVMGKRTPERNGYTAIQLGIDDKPLRLTSMPERGALAKANLKPKRFVREIRLPDGAADGIEVGAELNVADWFKPGDIVDVTGTTKGKGTQGVMKRHNMAGFRNSHGTHEFFRHGGSIGCRLTPGRVHKGKRMSGHMGNARRTVQNLKVVDVIADKNVLLVRGAIPGARNSYVIVRAAVKRPRPQA